MPQYDNDGAGKKVDKFMLTVAQDQLKCVVTLTGDAITHADITFKVQRNQHQHQVQRTSINQDSPWKLPQVQDAANHLYQAIHHIENVDDSYNFKTSDEVLHVLGNILGALQRGRTSLVIPKKKPIDELMKSRNMVRVFFVVVLRIIIILNNIPLHYLEIPVTKPSRGPGHQFLSTES